MKHVIASLALVLLVPSCDDSQGQKDRQAVAAQQSQYAARQPVPAFDWSLERELLISLYSLRNKQVATHAVWRSNTGVIEGDCASMGFGLPYDTSLTNPWKVVYNRGGAAVGQAEPNGIFASTNTSATWVMCTDESGSLLPVYVEAKVTVYPFAAEVNYETGRVSRLGGTPAVTIDRPSE